MSKEEQIGIYCQDDQHFHRGQIIKYLMVKQDKGSIERRLFCDECYLGKYNSYQQYCCNIQELISEKIYEAFKYTKFDSDIKQQYFNYARNHFPYLDDDFVKNMISSFEEEILSLIEAMKEKFLDLSKKYLDEIQQWSLKEGIKNYFKCDDLKQKLTDPKFERSPLHFEDLNKLAEKYVEKINTEKDDIMKVENILSQQKKFFNLDRFNASFKEVIKSIENMQNLTFSDYKLSQSTLSTPYIEKIVQTILPKQGEDEQIKFLKNMKLIYRMTQHGSNYQTLQQQLQQMQNQDTITIIQTKNKCIFGVYNCINIKEKSYLFQMNKEKLFQLKKDKQSFQLNLKTDLKSWIMKIGEEDIVINSTFNNCTSNLGTGFDIDGSYILNKKEYLSDCEYFDIYDMEIFLTQPQISPQSNIQQQQQQQQQHQPINQNLQQQQQQIFPNQNLTQRQTLNVNTPITNNINNQQIPGSQSQNKNISGFPPPGGFQPNLPKSSSGQDNN